MENEMKAVIASSLMSDSDCTIVIESEAEVEEHCKPTAAPEDTCVYLGMNGAGWQCQFQSIRFMMYKSQRESEGNPMTAKREGCQRVLDWFKTFEWGVDKLGTVHEI
tara:strand:- start:100 stop:420 length:321 start_codon:yes stop_codon:yes gene_type:complete